MPQAFETPGITLQIIYRTPPRTNAGHSAGNGVPSPSLHRRELEGVPEPAARQMLRDFATYQARRGSAKQHEVYRYQQRGADGSAGDKVMIALDFGEIVALNPSEREAEATKACRSISR